MGQATITSSGGIELSYTNISDALVYDKTSLNVSYLVVYLLNSRIILKLIDCNTASSRISGFNIMELCKVHISKYNVSPIIFIKRKIFRLVRTSHSSALGYCTDGN
jgi:hypothetical protein